MKLEADGFEFSFYDALDAYVFDEKDKSKPTFHKPPMKGVDIIAEFEDRYLFIEIKDYDDPSIYDVVNNLNCTDEERRKKQDGFRWLKKYLTYKFRDTYLCRYAEGKVDKPIHYICLLNFDSSLNSYMKKMLKKDLPVGKASSRWNFALASSCQVLSMDTWNQNFPKYPVTRLSTATA